MSGRTPARRPCRTQSGIRHAALTAKNDLENRKRVSRGSHEKFLGWELPQTFDKSPTLGAAAEGGVGLGELKPTFRAHAVDRVVRRLQDLQRERIDLAFRLAAWNKTDRRRLCA